MLKPPRCVVSSLQLLRQNLNDHAWDGDWYLRGYFDSGETLGSHLNDECQIDAIARAGRSFLVQVRRSAPPAPHAFSRSAAGG